MPRIHKEGRKPISRTLLILLLLNYISYIFGNPHPWVIIISSVVMLVVVVQFFYHPERKIEDPADNLVYSPADGTVVEIKTMMEEEFFKTEMIRISIFMNLFNVHLNRIPVFGKIVYQQYHPGKYLVAFHPKSSSLNENNAIGIETKSGHPVFIRQIAGFIARRIVSYQLPGALCTPGDELGFIRFGSRVDICLPTHAKIRVRLNQKTKAAISQLAEL